MSKNKPWVWELGQCETKSLESFKMFLQDVLIFPQANEEISQKVNPVRVG
jgi:hypothetical protein